MAYAEAACCTRETSVGNERDLAPHALPVEGRGGGEHFTHARPAFRTLIANDENVTFLVLAFLDGFESIFFAIKTARRAGEFQLSHACHFHDGTVRREIALEPHDTTGLGNRLVGGPHDVLIRVPLHALEVLRDGSAGYRHAAAV